MTSSPKKRAITRDIKINIRAQDRQRILIDQAAEILGKSRSDFMLAAACQKAKDVLLDQRFFSLSQDKWEVFLDALDASVEPNEKLENLLQTALPWKLNTRTEEEKRI